VCVSVCLSVYLSVRRLARKGRHPKQAPLSSPLGGVAACGHQKTDRPRTMAPAQRGRLGAPRQKVFTSVKSVMVCVLQLLESYAARSCFWNCVLIGLLKEHEMHKYVFCISSMRIRKEAHRQGTGSYHLAMHELCFCSQTPQHRGHHNACISSPVEAIIASLE
jgi:hypothetical protein